MKAKEYYTDNHTKDLSNNMPDPEYDRLTRKMNELDQKWRNIYQDLMRFLNRDKKPF